MFQQRDVSLQAERRALPSARSRSLDQRCCEPFCANRWRVEVLAAPRRGDRPLRASLNSAQPVRPCVREKFFSDHRGVLDRHWGARAPRRLDVGAAAVSRARFALPGRLGASRISGCAATGQDARRGFGYASADYCIPLCEPVGGVWRPRRNAWARLARKNSNFGTLVSISWCVSCIRKSEFNVDCARSVDIM